MLWQRMNRNTLLTCALGVLLALGGLSRLSSAATINYGNFGPVPPGITFIDVTESSGTDPVPLYGPPDPFTTGLDFDPNAYVSASAGGSPSPEITDGQLNFIIQSVTGLAIQNFTVRESGDYTLFAPGGVAANPLFTTANVNLPVSVTVTQVDGINIAPQALAPLLATLSFNFGANPGTNFWSLTLPYNVEAALTNKQIPFVLGATRIEVAIDNQLITSSEAAGGDFPATSAFIAKKDFSVDVGTKVPEPATALLMIGGCLAVSTLARRVRS